MVNAIFIRVSKIVRSLLACIGCVAVLSGCAWLDAEQRRLIYRPTPGVPADFPAWRAPDQRYFVQQPRTADAASVTDSSPAVQQLELWWLASPNPKAPTLLYLHGTFRNLYQNIEKINALREAGFSILAVDYRGWGRSSPIVPSEQSIIDDATLAWHELSKREPRPAMRVIYGHSMGSGAAVALASSLESGTDYGALILESAFTSFSDVAWQAGVLAGALVNFNNERFDSLTRITRIKAPVLMLHGSADTTVPQVLGQTLFAAANAPKQWLSISGGTHSSLQQDSPDTYQTGLRRFIQTYLKP